MVEVTRLKVPEGSLESVPSLHHLPFINSLNRSGMTAALSCSPSPPSLFLTLGNKAGPEASYLTLVPLCQKVQVVTRLPAYYTE